MSYAKLRIIRKLKIAKLFYNLQTYLMILSFFYILRLALENSLEKHFPFLKTHLTKYKLGKAIQLSLTEIINGIFLGYFELW